MRPSEWARIRARDVECPTCAAPPGNSCLIRQPWDTEPVSFGYHWLRAQVADEQDAAARRREHPACRCGRTRAHLAGSDCGEFPASVPPWW